MQSTSLPFPPVFEDKKAFFIWLHDGLDQLGLPPVAKARAQFLSQQIKGLYEPVAMLMVKGYVQPDRGFLEKVVRVFEQRLKARGEDGEETHSTTPFYRPLAREGNDAAVLRGAKNKKIK